MFCDIAIVSPGVEFSFRPHFSGECGKGVVKGLFRIHPRVLPSFSGKWSALSPLRSSLSSSLSWIALSSLLPRGDEASSPALFHRVIATLSCLDPEIYIQILVPLRFKGFLYFKSFLSTRRPNKTPFVTQKDATDRRTLFQQGRNNWIPL